MKTPMTIIISLGICNLDFFWLGGGHVDLKIRIGYKEFFEKWSRSDIFIFDLV